MVSTASKEKVSVVVSQEALSIIEAAEVVGITVRLNELGDIKLIENTGMQRAKKIHTAAVSGTNIGREELITYVDEGVKERGGVARRHALEKLDLGRISIEAEKGEKKQFLEKRAEVLAEALGLDFVAEQIEDGGKWNKKYGLWMEAVWEAAAALRGGKKTKNLTDAQKAGWESIGLNIGLQEEVILYQELMKYYGIDPESVFSQEGVLKTTGGEALSKTVADLNQRQKPPSLYQPWRQRFEEWRNYQDGLINGKQEKTTVEDWQKDRYDRFVASQKDEEGEPMPFKDWKALDNLKMAAQEDSLKIQGELNGSEGISLAELMIHLENKRMGDVAHAYLLTEMERFLDKAFGGQNQLPISYAIAGEAGREGIIFTNFFGNRLHDELVTVLRASGNFFFWESVGRLERMIRFTQSGFGENRVSKEAWAALEGVSPPVVQFILLSDRRLGRAFGKALMLPEIVGVRDWRTGRPGMLAQFDAHGISKPPEKDEPIGLLAPSKKARESARRKMEDMGYPRWIADLAMAHSWMSGEGVDLSRCLTKVRAGEELVFSIVGALVEPFFEYDGKKLDAITDSTGESGWGREYAFMVLRWLTPGVTPFITLTQDAWKLMSMSPWAKDLWFSSFYSRMPAYGWVNQQDKERLQIAMKAMDFSGPYKNIWQRYLGEIEHREQKRWGTYFHIVDKAKLMDAGGESLGFWRYPFDFNNQEHVQRLAGLITSGSMAEKMKAKMRLLGVPAQTVNAWTNTDMVNLINSLNTQTVREGANTLQIQWFDSVDPSIDANKLIAAGGKKTAYDIWQQTLDLADRRGWLDVTVFRGANGPQELAVKLELILRDLDTWGLEADTTKPEILSHLADSSERLASSMARYFFSTSYLYDDYASWDRFAEAFPDINSPLSLEKIEELSHKIYNEYPTRTGGLPHIKQFLETLMFRVWYFKQIAVINAEMVPGLGPGHTDKGTATDWMFNRSLRKQLADILEQA